MKLTKKDAVVLALSTLGGIHDVVHTEDAAIAAHSLDQASFGWKKYPERIDLDAVRTTLRHEGEAANPRIEGSVQNGWHLTPRGVAWAAEHADLLAGNVTIDATPAATARRRAETRDNGAALSRIHGSRAFGQWSRGEAVSARDAAAVFRIDEYTPAKTRSRKIAQIQDLSAGDAQAQQFIREVTDLVMSHTITL